jgi:ribonuclease HI
MELQAALSALQALKRPCRITLCTDSEYLQRGMTEWLPAWLDRGWRTSDDRPVQNQDLWQALATEVQRHEIEWRWVRGHTGNPLNERVDQLARAAIPRPNAPDASALNQEETDAKTVQLYTRASCLGSPGPGGWAVVLRRGEEVTSLTGSAPETTANAMELKAALQGLRSLNEPSRAKVYTVSKYLFQGITEWVGGWQARSWLTKAGQPVRHKTLWLALQEAAAQHEVVWNQLPAENRPPESEQAAVLAAQAARTAREKVQHDAERPD